MKQVTKKGLITVVAAGGMLGVPVGYAHADAGARGSSTDSPGVLSGNTIQVPINIPVNLCGNTVNVVGLLNPAIGNKCANVSTGHEASGSGATGVSHGSPGVASGNTVQVPVEVPVNACGNSVNVVGVGNPALGNKCANVSTGTSGGHLPLPPHHPTPQVPHQPSHPGTHAPSHNPSVDVPTPVKASPVPVRQVTSPVKAPEQLAQTGSSAPLELIIPASAGMLIGGFALYRRGRRRVRA